MNPKDLSVGAVKMRRCGCQKRRVMSLLFGLELTQRRVGMFGHVGAG